MIIPLITRNIKTSRLIVLKALLLNLSMLVWATGLVVVGISFTGQAYAVTATASPSLCVNDASIGVATGNWTGLTNVGTQNNVYAQASVANSDITNYLKCTGYGFSIPAGATINGITVGPWLNASFTMYDNAMQLVKGGAIQATNLATGANIPNGGGSFAATPTQFTYGGSTNLWGNTWTAADINSANFGAAFAAQRGGFATTQQVGVDAMPITVDYTPSAGGGGGGVSGGCSTSAVGSDTVVTCTGDGGITIPSGVTSVRYLVVGGGGGGGGNTGGWGSGAGGAGGVLQGTGFAVTGGATYTVTVGAGGSGGTGGVSLGGNGGDSTFSTLTAIGGGGGATQGISNNGANGGSGGAGRGNGSGGTGTAGQGNNGGDGLASGSSAGGGGGAGGAGANAVDRNGGSGGIPVSDNITGAAITYGAGGDGGGRDSGYSGGNGAAGAPNSGDGGDGTPGRGGTTTGGAGGSGVVIIRYTPATVSVSSINLASSNPTSPATSVSWTVTFSTSVTGVDATDFALVPAGSVTGASITSVTGSGTTWTVTANTGSGYGTLGLNLVDDDSIVDGSGNKLGGTGAGNGNFTGQVYTISAIPVLANYRMDEASWNGTANEVVDSSGNGNNAQSFNSASTDGTTPAIAGNPGTCRYGVIDNGTSITQGYIQTPLPDLTSDFTVTAWIRTTNNTASGQRILIDDQNNTVAMASVWVMAAQGKSDFIRAALHPSFWIPLTPSQTIPGILLLQLPT